MSKPRLLDGFCGTAFDNRPLLYDLYCGGGGAAKGYETAGFRVVGIDHNPQPRFAGSEFVQMDVFEFMARYEAGEYPEASAFHASPVCKGYSVANNIHGRADHPMDIPRVREALVATGKPYVIENVPKAGEYMLSPALVCGLALGCNVKRHRLFESNVLLYGTICPPGHPGDWVSVFGHTVLERSPAVGRTAKNGPIFRRKHLGTDVGRAAMGIPWMTREELSDAIPPAYTFHIGTQIMWHLEGNSE